MGAGGKGMRRDKKPRTDTRALMDRRACLNGSKPSQVNAKCDVVMKLSVFGTRAGTHTQGKTYTSSLRGL